MGFALLSGRADIWGPLALAGEALYVGGLATRPRFQAYVDAQAAKIERQVGSVHSARVLDTIVRKLPQPSVERFEALRARCMELRQIALEIKDPARVNSPLPLEQMQLAGLDRLLWIYLRLLFTESSLERFLQRTSAEQIEADIADLEKQLERTAEVQDETQKQKMRRALDDNLQTCRDRLANYHKARDNYDIVQLEIDRLENKIRALSELAVNRQEPDFISTQVDEVASSMLQTERTMNELKFATGLDTVDESIPQLLQRGITTATR